MITELECRSLHFRPMSSEISDLLLFVSHFAFESRPKGIQFGDYFLVCVV